MLKFVNSFCKNKGKIISMFCKHVGMTHFFQKNKKNHAFSWENTKTKFRIDQVLNFPFLLELKLSCFGKKNKHQCR